MQNIPTRLSNPGDLKFAGQSGATADSTGFAKFSNPQAGMAALLNDIQHNINNDPNAPVADFIAKYAPQSENNTAQYLANLANKAHFRPDAKMRDIQPIIGQFADAISGNEGYQSAPPDSSNLPGVGFLGAAVQSQFSAPQQQGQQSPDPVQNNPFATSNPLQNIASGNEQANVDVAKGALKGAGGFLMDIGGADLNPVVKNMIGNAGLTGAVQAARQATQPSNPAEEQGTQLSNLASGLIPSGEGAGLVKTGLTEAKGLVSTALTGAEDPVLTAVSPRLTPAVAAETKTTTQGLLSKIVPASTNYLKKVADTVRPYFDPKAPWSINAQAADAEIGKEAQSLESTVEDANHPAPIRELQSSLAKTEAPISLKGTSFEKQIGPLVKAAGKLMEERGGTVKGAFLALRDFDNLVEKTWPTLWDSEHSPMRGAVTSIRNQWKKFIVDNISDPATKHVYENSLEKQSLLYKARDTFREKATLGERQTQGEIGTTGPQRFMGRHQGLVNVAKKVGEYGLIGAGIGGVVTGYNAAKSLLSE